MGDHLDMAAKTPKVTAQRGIQNLASPLTRCLRTRQMQFKYRHLNTDVNSDTLFLLTKSARGFECAQLFVTDQEFADVYPMHSKAEALYKLDTFCKTHGLPQTLVTDLAPEETKGEWEKVVKQYLLSQRTSEAHLGWKKRAEIEIGN
jgi:hypothetical protein